MRRYARIMFTLPKERTQKSQSVAVPIQMKIHPLK